MKEKLKQKIKMWAVCGVLILAASVGVSKTVSVSNTVNGKELIAWGGPKRDDLRDDWDAEPDEEKAAYHYSFKEYEETNYPYKYETLTEYMCDEIGASMESNVCALAVDLARANGLTMSRLFELYEG